MKIALLIIAAITATYVIFAGRKYRRLNKQVFLNSEESIEFNRISNEIVIMAAISLFCIGIFLMLILK